MDEMHLMHKVSIKMYQSVLVMHKGPSMDRNASNAQKVDKGASISISYA